MVYLKAKSSHEAEVALQIFLGPRIRVEFIYSDNSPGLKNAVDQLSVPHGLATPEDPQSNGVIERQVRHLTEGACTAWHTPGRLSRSGRLPESTSRSVATLRPWLVIVMLTGAIGRAISTRHCTMCG